MKMIKLSVIFYKHQLVMTQGSKRMHPSLVENAFSFIVKIPADRGLVKNTLLFVINIQVDRRPSGLHLKNRNASDSYDSCYMQLESSGTYWDAYFYMFSYIVRIADRTNARSL